MAIVTGFSSMAQTSNSTSNKHKEFNNRQSHLGGKNFKNHNLTDDQKAQIKTLNESFRQQMQDLNKNTNLSADELKDKRQALVKEHKEKVNAILTPGQRNQAHDMKHAKGNKAEKRNEKFEGRTKDLHLPHEQSTEMKNLNSALKNNIKSIRKNTALSHEEKKEQMKSLMKKHKNDMEALLTNEQKQQLKNNHKNRRNEAVK